MAGPTERRAPFATTLALAVVLGFAAFAVVMPVILISSQPTPLDPPLPPQNQDAETLSYLLAYAVILPLALIAARRLADTIEAGPNASALPVLCGLLAAVLAAAILGVKLCYAVGLPDGVRTVLAAAAVWWLAAGATLWRATRPWPALVRLSGMAVPAWAAAATLTFAVLLCMTDLGSISPLGVAAGAAAVAVAIAVHRRAPRLPRPWGAAADAAVVGLVLLAVPDLVIFRPEEAAGDLNVAIETGIIQYHQNFLLGPANEVLHGRAMLVGNASQYGVGPIYLLAGWFLVAPIGYGTAGFLVGVLTALWFAAGYAVLRMAGTSRALAASALAIAVVVLVFNLFYPVGALPQSGPLRFGLPMAVIVAAVAGERRPAAAGAGRAVALAAVGVSALWSLEALASTLAVFAAVACMQAWLDPGPGRLRRLAGQAGLAAAACVAAHAAFAVATLAATARLPDWGEYLDYLRVFLFGAVGDLTYDVPRWTPGLAVGAAYLASGAAIVELARRDLMRRERTALVALTGTTAYGVALLAYYVDRSQDHILLHVALPAVLLGALWLGLLLRSRDSMPRGLRAGGLAFGAAAGVLVLAVAWSAIGDRFGRSALAHAAPGGSSLRGALDRLWHPPALDPSAPAAERALDRHMPGERRSLVMTAPDLGTEAMIRSGRADRLLLADPWEASFVADDQLPRLRETVAGLRPGERMLMDARARELLGVLERQPDQDPLELTPPLLTPLQQWALKAIRERFRLRPVAPDQDGFTVVELSP